MASPPKFTIRFKSRIRLESDFETLRFLPTLKFQKSAIATFREPPVANPQQRAPVILFLIYL